MTSVEYLGFKISPKGIEMDPKKVETITTWTPPTTATGVRSFLGFANFYRRFIYEYSRVASPLFGLLKKDITFNWTLQCNQAFEDLKERFTTGPILKHFEGNRPTRIETDASDYAIAAVLLQEGDDGELHPIAFASRTLAPAEKNYEVYDKEMLAIVYACIEWRPLLLSLDQRFEILTDHRSLAWFMTTKVLNCRQVRWAERLADFEFEITYRPGTLNNQADALSRRDDVYPSVGGTSFATKNPENFRQFFQPHHLRLGQATPSYLADNLIDNIRQSQLTDTKLVELRELEGTDPRYTIENNLLLFEGRIFVPDNDSLKLQILQSRHDHRLAGHPGRTKTLQLIRRDFHWDGI
jgi:hypothetical protein